MFNGTRQGKLSSPFVSLPTPPSISLLPSAVGFGSAAGEAGPCDHHVPLTTPPVDSHAISSRHGRAPQSPWHLHHPATTPKASLPINPRGSATGDIEYVDATNSHEASPGRWLNSAHPRECDVPHAFAHPTYNGWATTRIGLSGISAPSERSSTQLCRVLHEPLQQDIYDSPPQGPYDPLPIPTVSFSRLLPNGSLAHGIVAADLFPQCEGNFTINKVVQRSGLFGAEDEVDLGGSAKISHRIMIVAFTSSGERSVLAYSRQVPGRTSALQQRHLQKAAVVWHAAKTLHAFARQQPNPNVFVLYGNEMQVRFDELVMLGLYRVSDRSFQILLARLPP